jgi:hypothetical protein
MWSAPGFSDQRLVERLASERRLGMKTSKFTEEQIVGILQETDRDTVGTVAKRHGVSDQAIYTLKKRFV